MTLNCLKENNMDFSWKRGNIWHRVAITYLQKKSVSLHGHGCYIRDVEFRRGEVLEYCLMSGRPASVAIERNIDSVQYTVMDNKRLAVNPLAKAISTTRVILENILHTLNWRDESFGSVGVTCSDTWSKSHQAEHITGRSVNVWSSSIWFSWTFPISEQCVGLSQQIKRRSMQKKHPLTGIR